VNDFGFVASEPSLLGGPVNQLTVLLVLGLGLGGVMCGLSWVLAPVEPLPQRDKAKKYECGFDPFQHGLHAFSIHFFRIGLLFLLFDLELIFLFPWCVVLQPLFALGTLAHF
jgi:NADH:ubiquinone oxidoreductase subunit 3 (subunit A)